MCIIKLFLFYSVTLPHQEFNSAPLPRRYHAALLACALFAFALVWYITGAHGIALSNDSAAYISTARSVMRGGGMNFSTGEPLVVLAPLYPFVLGAIGGVLAIDPLRLAPALNALLLGGSVYWGGRIAFRVLEIPAVALAATLALVFAPALTAVADYAWSETLFIFLTTLALALAYDYLETYRTKPLVLLAIALALACLTRYAGAVLLAWGAVLALVLSRATRARKLRDTVLLLGIVALPLSLWALRNLLVSGTLFGGRPSSIFSLTQNLEFTMMTFKGWYLPGRLGSPPIAFAVVAGVGLFVGVCWRANPAPLKRFLRVQAPVIAFALGYVVFLIVSGTLTAFDRIGDRLLSPVVVPLTLLLFGLLEAVARAAPAVLARRILYGALALVVAGWLVNIATSDFAFAQSLRDRGRGYTEQKWRTSPTIAFVRAGQLPKDCAPMSNNPQALYLLTDLVMPSSPAKGKHNSPEVVRTDIQQLRGKWLTADKTCLIWFEGGEKGIFFEPQELQTIAQMQTIGKFEDGAVYLVTQE